MTHTVHLQFEDYNPVALQRLCGALDNNLNTLAHRLEVQISRRFDYFTFSGSLAHVARNALVSLMDIAEERDLSDDDINLAAVEAKTNDKQHIEKIMKITLIIFIPSAVALADVHHAKTVIFALC